MSRYQPLRIVQRDVTEFSLDGKELDFSKRYDVMPANGKSTYRNCEIYKESFQVIADPEEVSSTSIRSIAFFKHGTLESRLKKGILMALSRSK